MSISMGYSSVGSNMSYAHLGLGLAQVRLSLTRSIYSDDRYMRCVFILLEGMGNLEFVDIVETVFD